MNLTISGTNRLGSNSLKVAKYYQQQFRKKGEEWDLLSLEELPHDLIFTDLYNKRSDAFLPIQERVSRAKKFIFIIPEYNGSYPGVLKVVIAACSFPISFYHKRAVLVGASTGKCGKILGVDQCTGVCNYLRMHVLPLKIRIAHSQIEINDDNILNDEITVKLVNEHIEEALHS